MQPVMFSILGFDIRFYGVAIALGFFLALKVAKTHAKEIGFPLPIVENFAFIAMFSGVLGARIYYIIFNWGYYSKNLREILIVWHGGLAIHGGIIGGMIGAFIYANIKKVKTLTFGDMAAAPFLLGQSIGRIGNFMNGEIHGVPVFTPLKVIFSIRPTFYNWYSHYMALPIIEKMNYNNLVPWGVTFPVTSSAGSEFPDTPLHPAMLYELVLNFIGFLIIWFILKKKKNRKTGYLWWWYLIIYSIIRIFVSFFRAEDLMFLGFRAPHVISAIIILISIIGLNFNERRKLWKIK
ncbi:MAG: prolipoprotein diacylglyceryl transferase [Fusobacteriaceae bacterium]|nr:prolipoprotein diacylglyceryl transferase [Fusobacteriaceae bacterium]